MKDLVDKIKSIGNCHNCGGHYTFNGTCFYCKHKNEELSNLLLKIKEIIEKNKNVNFINDIDNQLFRLKYYEEINEYLKSKEYYKLLKDKEIELYKKIVESSSICLNDEESKLVQFLSVNSMNPQCKKTFGIYVILSNYAQKNKYSKSDFIETIKSTFTEMMKQYAYITKFNINSNINDNILGNESFIKKGKMNIGIINIKSEEIDTLYNSESILPLQTIFHEYYHLVQESLLKEANLFNRDALCQIEDFVLSAYLDGYYHSNYIAISFENDAELASAKDLMNLLKSFKINIKEKDLKEMQNIIKNSEVFQNKIPYRIYNNKIYTLDNLFDNYINTTDKADKIFEIYPQLKYIYEFVAGKYYRKTQERINEIEKIYTKMNMIEKQAEQYMNEIQSHIK